VGNRLVDLGQREDVIEHRLDLPGLGQRTRLRVD
jgi:hypothetical protein